MRRLFFAMIGCAVAAPMFQNCSQTQQGVGFGVSAQGCQAAIQTANRLTKFMIIVDITGSSALDDPGRVLRSGSTQAFFDTYQSKQNFQWGMIAFNTTTYALSSPAFTSFSGTSSTLQALANQPDQGDTYMATAIETAKTDIQNDPDFNSSQNPQYVVLLMSDGEPTPGTGDPVAAVQDLMSLAPDRITFSTLYFSRTTNWGPVSLLQSMAQAGKGFFSWGKTFPIDTIITVPGASCGGN